MARTLEDLKYFTKSYVEMKPWRYDGTVHPLEWRDQITTEFEDKKVLKVGIMWDDGESLSIIRSILTSQASSLLRQHALALFKQFLPH
jgi:hypothetical protein